MTKREFQIAVVAQVLAIMLPVPGKSDAELLALLTRSWTSAGKVYDAIPAP